MIKKFTDMSYKEKALYFQAEGYIAVKKLPDGRIIAVMQMLFTTGIFVNLREFDYDYRFCYETTEQALNEFLIWTGIGEPKNYKVKK